ncbi:MAG: hypothetical protein HY749_20445 [Gammaproteobacteria bacterium]|nr:hypothetical protein [Gammaproteobacteria bacterium]
MPCRSPGSVHEHPESARYQPPGAVNSPSEFAFTRITETRHLAGQRAAGTSIVKEHPGAEGDPCHPIPNVVNEALDQRYGARARRDRRVFFAGRRAQ